MLLDRHKSIQIDIDGQLARRRLAISRDREMSIQIRPQPAPWPGFFDLPKLNLVIHGD
jgi:hypothetical protein